MQPEREKKTEEKSGKTGLLKAINTQDTTSNWYLNFYNSIFED